MKTNNVKPKVSVETLYKKLHEGLNSNNWSIVGVGGTKVELMKPIVEYLRKAGIEVK